MPMLAYDAALLNLGEDPSRTQALLRGAEVLRGLREAPGVTFMGLPWEDLSGCVALAEAAQAWVRDLIVVGIGGSSLGLIAALQALEGARRGPGAGIRVHVVESTDARAMHSLLERVDLEHAMVNVVTKSGTTIETMSNFLVLRERLRDAFGEEGYRRRVVATTDPEAGMLRALAREESLVTLPIPSGTGGRYSVLSAVGLFPLAVAGVDVEAICAGARVAAEQAMGEGAAEAPCHAFAADQVHLYRQGFRQVVMLPYGDRLARLGDWFVQLWAESLGKRVRGDGSVVGPTPIAGLGPQDQHSLFQLFMEGPDERSIVFVRSEGSEAPALHVPQELPAALARLSHLGGKSLDAILEMEFEAVREALREAGRRSATITFHDGPEGVGAFLQTLEMATALAGALFDVDPFDQPGVESSKVIAHGLLGREAGGRIDEERISAFRKRAQMGRHTLERGPS